MTSYAYHGINTAQGSGRMDGLKPYLPGPEMREYGWTMPPCSIGKAERVVEKDVKRLKEGDWLVGFSHGALICHMLATHPDCPRLAGVVIMQGALREDTIWPSYLPVLCLHNSNDFVVVFGRFWGRLAHGGPTGWGSAGRNGFCMDQSKVANLDVASPLFTVDPGIHGGILEDPAVSYWGERIARWMADINSERG